MDEDVLILAIEGFTALLAGLIILFYAVLKSRGRKRTQDEIVKAKTDILRKGSWFPVRYSSETRFRKLWKLFPWEATGILFIGDTDIFFFSRLIPWKDLELKFSLEHTHVTWIGRNIWPNGFTSWFAIDFKGETHYFTSETGATIRGTGKRTREIYEELVKAVSSGPVS